MAAAAAAAFQLTHHFLPQSPIFKPKPPPPSHNRKSTSFIVSCTSSSSSSSSNQYIHGRKLRVAVIGGGPGVQLVLQQQPRRHSHQEVSKPTSSNDPHLVGNHVVEQYLFACMLDEFSIPLHLIDRKVAQMKIISPSNLPKSDSLGDLKIMAGGDSNHEVISVQDISKSNEGLLQSSELYQYILETSVYPREAAVLKELRDITSTQERNYMRTAADQGPLMAILLKLVNAKKTIEIGVYTGYSLLLTALVLPEDGKIVAIDIDREAFEVGLPLIKKAGVEHKVEFIESAALPVLDKLLEDPKNEGSFDYAFVDADKGNYLNYHERLLKLVRVGGIIVYDNTLWSGTVAWANDKTLDEDMKAIRDIFIKVNKFLASDPRVQISQLSIGDGITICFRV